MTDAEMIVHDDIRSGCCGVVGSHRTGCLEVKRKVTEPTDIARGILWDWIMPSIYGDGVIRDTEKKLITDHIVTALREMYEQGRKDEQKYALDVSGFVQKADAAGYERGLKDGRNESHK